MSPLNNYDPFAKQKQDTFSASSIAVLKLAERMQIIVKKAPQDNMEAHQIHFMELAQTCLWGNATDLSLLTDLRLEDVAKLQTTSKENEKNVLVNDLPKVWEYFKNLKDDRIDIVLDNAGFELYVDLIFADWLVAAGFAKEVVFHPKNLPWFVSDVMPSDFDWLLSSLNDPSFFSESSSLREMAARWSKYVQHGQWKLSFSQSIIGQKGPGDFWTSQHPYTIMPSKASQLFEELQKSKLIIFKGDLNYRKLTSDAKWPRTTPFKTAIGDMNGRLPILSLRTCKADVVVGLSNGDEAQLDKVDPRWAVNGKYAVISFSPGRS